MDKQADKKKQDKIVESVPFNNKGESASSAVLTNARAEVPVTKNVEELHLMQLPPPEPVSMKPDTLAWDLVFALIFIAIVVYLLRRYQDHQKARWKRQALKLAEQARKQKQTHIWFALIKRVYLVHHTRQASSEIDDNELLSILPELDIEACEQLQQAHYQKSDDLSEQINEAVYLSFVSWVKGLPIEAEKNSTPEPVAASNV